LDKHAFLGEGKQSTHNRKISTYKTRVPHSPVGSWSLYSLYLKKKLQEKKYPKRSY
jgi:hypothetical protein